MATFPIDMIMDILSRLPVKTLVRFKSVSKPWISLLDDPEFVKLHLHRSFKTGNNLKLLLHSHSSFFHEACSVDFDSLDNLVELPRPFTSRGSTSSPRIFGDCNGLVAVYHETSIALWNPSTRDIRYLPNLSIGDPKKGDYNFLGFGYDAINNDYKVVILMAYGRKVMIYSLKTNSWKRIKKCPYKIPPYIEQQDGAYVNSSLHWPVEKIIFGLDLTVEEYHVIPEEFSFKNGSDYMNVGVLGGSLCVFRQDRYNPYPQGVYFGLWVMKEYGVKESWTELVGLLPSWHLRNMGSTKAIAYSRSGDKILLEDGGYTCKPAWFDLKRARGEKLLIPGAPTRYNARTYVESLVAVLPRHH